MFGVINHCVLYIIITIYYSIVNKLPSAAGRDGANKPHLFCKFKGGIMPPGIQGLIFNLGKPEKRTKIYAATCAEFAISLFKLVATNVHMPME